MKDMKLSNIQKESEKIKIKKSINEYEDLKSQSLLKLGIMTFDKIRKSQIHEDDFNEICEEIKNYDIEIYTKYMQLRSFENESKKTTCECGYVAFKNEKFCPQCGNNLIKEETSYIICPNCNQEIDEDSKYCSCCGNKIEKMKYTYDDESEVIYCEDKSFDCYTKEEAPEVDMVEENILNAHIASDEDIAKETFLEIEGKEFLKSHEEHIIE